MYSRVTVDFNTYIRYKLVKQFYIILRRKYNNKYQTIHILFIENKSDLKNKIYTK